MRTKHFLFLALLLIGLQAIAQKTFTGYYINIQGDTTRVSFPGYRQWNNNPQQIQARTADGEDRVLTPENTRQVTIEGFDTYMSRRFTRLTNPYDLFDGFNALSSVDATEEIKGFLLFLTKAKGSACISTAIKSETTTLSKPPTPWWTCSIRSISMRTTAR